MSRNKKYIIITGQIASGKSSISELIEKRSDDYLVLDADDQIRDLYRRGAVLYDVLVNEFGDSILNDKKNISKSKLRELVFFDEEKRKRLNDLTHPVILKNMIREAKESDKDVIFLQIPLLNESIDKLEKLVKISEVWNINADYNTRYNRLMSRKGMTSEVAKKIMSIQKEFENENYDVLTVDNNGNIDELEEKLDLFFENGILAKKKKGLFGRKKLKEEKNEQNTEIEEDFFDFIAKEEMANKEDMEVTNKLSKVEDENTDDLGATRVVKLDKDFNEKIQETNTFVPEVNTDTEDLDTEYTDFSMEIEDGEEEKVPERKRRKKKKKKIGRRILVFLLGIFLLVNTIFFSAVAYGGKTYPVEYLEEIEKYSKEYNMDPKVVLAIMKVESNFNSTAQSHANAKGLMQILPDTAKHVAQLLKMDANSIDLNDPETNIKIGTYYLKYLSNNFSNMDTVYAAYNGGIGNVNNWLKDEKYSRDGVSLYNIPVAETSHYVYKVNKALKAYEILYGKEFPTKKKKGFAKFIENSKNTIKYILNSF